MAPPIRLTCKSIEDIPAVAELEHLTASGTHVVLQFPPELSRDETGVIIDRLSREMPNHSVFYSGGNAESERVTVTPVIRTETVLVHQEEFRRAIQAYKDASVDLVQRMNNGTLPSCYSAQNHGEHCRFENRETGQVVEAPLEGFVNDLVDPYFLGIFIRSTPKFGFLATLIRHDFHDGARILEILDANS